MQTRDITNEYSTLYLYHVNIFQIFCVGITDLIDVHVLKDISSPPQKEGITYFLSPDFASVSEILETVLTAACN